ncbi:glycoside hydrolase family 6 protein [Nonomuraea sp. NPDC050404]|uniref:glycoside hydrolase family 6 protein n=1 Tax=Nonomuraea sp. NPDC050404 TaxID=3155783 RepID=UPI0033D8E2FB
MTLESLRDGDPRQVGPYTLFGRLGEGGMGVVYLGQGPDGTRVAVKLIRARLGAQADFRRRFAREVAAAKRVARFCTAPVLDADVEGDVAYLVTEYVEGPSLRDVVQTSGPLKGSALDGLAAAMAMALRAIHGAGVVHRDLKPSNVLLSQVGPKVIDFGIAQFADAEMSSEVLGTPLYMSPEQVSEGAIGPASDIFSWGGTLAFAAGGKPPFGTGSVPAVLMRIVSDPPDLGGLSGPLRDLVAASLAKDPAARPTAQELMDHLSTGDTGTAALAGLRQDTPSPIPGLTSGTDTGGRMEPVTDTGGRAEPVAAPNGRVEPVAATHGRAEPIAATHGRPEPVADTDGKARGAAHANRRRKLLTAAVAVVVAIAGVSAAVYLRARTTSAANTGTTATTGTTGTTVPGQNPLRSAQNVRFYGPKEPGAARQQQLWRQTRPQDAELMRALAETPHAIRLNQPEIRPRVRNMVAAAKQAGGVPVFLVNYLPGDGCRPFTPSETTAYHQWIEGIAAELGRSKAVVILEPGTLVKVPGLGDCATGTPDQRYRELRRAVQLLKANPDTAVYLDGSQRHWPGTEAMAERLISAGIAEADGFFVNVAGYHGTDSSVEYGKAVSACVSVRMRTGTSDCPEGLTADPAAMPHFVVDTSRSGVPEPWKPAKQYKDPQTWCNPPGRGVGERPTTETGEELVDAYLWIARAGTSSGRCRRGTQGEKDPERGVVSPSIGQWWGELALERAKNAGPPLR